MRFRLFTILLTVIASGDVIGASAERSPGSAAAGSEMIEALHEADRVRDRRFAAWALGRMDPVDPDAVPALIEALASDDRLLLRYASDALVRIGPAAASPLCLALETAEGARREAERVLATFGESAVPCLVQQVEGSRSEMGRRSAARVLAEIGSGAAAAVEPLIRALRTARRRADSVQYSLTLGRIGPAALPALVDLARSDPEMRESVFRSLEVMGADARDSVPLLVETLAGDDESNLRYRAALALGGIGPAAEDAVPALIDRLESDPSSTVRMYSAVALGQIGRGRDRSIPALVTALSEPNPQVPPRAAAALAALGPPAVPAVEQALRTGDTQGRRFAAAALGRMRDDADLVGPILIEAFGHEDDAVGDALVIALLQLEPFSVAPLVEALSSHADPRVRGYCALTLGRMEPPPEAARPALAAAVRDAPLNVRRIACWTLGRYGAEARETLPTLVDATRADDPLLRRNAIWALGNIGPDALAAESAVMERLEDPDDGVREQAAEALDKIRGVYVYTE